MKIEFQFKPKNQQQKNKICGTVFEKYTAFLLNKIYENEIIKQANVRNFVTKKMLKWYLIYFKSYFAIAKYDPIKYLSVIENGDSFFSDVLKKRRYKSLKIIRLDKIVKLADMIVITKNKDSLYDTVYIIDSKYREKDIGKITNGDFLRLMCYKKIIEESSEINEIKYIKPVFIISSDSFSFSKEIRHYYGKLFNVKTIGEFEKLIFPEFSENQVIRVYIANWNEYIARLNDTVIHRGEISW